MASLIQYRTFTCEVLHSLPKISDVFNLGQGVIFRNSKRPKFIGTSGLFFYFPAAECRGDTVAGNTCNCTQLHKEIKLCG